MDLFKAIARGVVVVLIVALLTSVGGFIADLLRSHFESDGTVLSVGIRRTSYSQEELIWIDATNRGPGMIDNLVLNPLDYAEYDILAIQYRDENAWLEDVSGYPAWQGQLLRRETVSFLIAVPTGTPLDTTQLFHGSAQLQDPTDANIDTAVFSVWSSDQSFIADLWRIAYIAIGVLAGLVIFAIAILVYRSLNEE